MQAHEFHNYAAIYGAGLRLNRELALLSQHALMHPETAEALLDAVQADIAAIRAEAIVTPVDPDPVGE